MVDELDLTDMFVGERDKAYIVSDDDYHVRLKEDYNIVIDYAIAM